jgi:flavin reductase (DIM6/NTAB) family NADH-FMN oxidoreductase RutF
MSLEDSFISVRPGEISGRERYALLTSLVVPRPIGWISTRSAVGVPNLAPFSYFAALAGSPPLVGVSIGSRGGEPKDTLVNIRETGAFCVNVCSEELLEAMNVSSGEYPPDVNEFVLSRLTMAEGEEAGAPFVGEAPAVLECRVFKEVGLEPAKNVLVIGEVVCVHLSKSLGLLPGSWAVDPMALRPVGRLGSDRYLLPREIVEIPRPK